MSVCAFAVIYGSMCIICVCAAGLFVCDGLLFAAMVAAAAAATAVKTTATAIHTIYTWHPLYFRHPSILNSKASKNKVV